MKIQMQDIINSEGALNRLMANQFPVKLSYKLSRILTATQQETKHFYRLREELIKRFGEEVNDGGWQVKNEHIPVFNKEFEDLMQLQVKIWGDPIKVEELGNISIAPADLSAIAWLFEQEEQAQIASA